MRPSPRQGIELFHLSFLRVLAAKGEDKSLFALKGGCNLRFYFGSARYSEDIDLDVAPSVLRQTLEKKIDRTLASTALVHTLRAKGIEVVETSKPKQTETTQRWKAGLQIAELGVVRTKIEFSRRGKLAGCAFEAIDREILRPYGLSGFLATHYRLEQAIAQKIKALAGRREPQARDLFDLSHLFARPDARIASVEAGVVESALEKAISISYDDYASQVIAYLEPDDAEPLSSREAWDLMRNDVVARLEAAR
jgi:predicted nucleotidyltransferase component of viral defense system